LVHSRITNNLAQSREGDVMDKKTALYNNKELFEKMNEGGGLFETTYRELVDIFYQAGWDDCKEKYIHQIYPEPPEPVHDMGQ
jgi:hypothetical protein